MDTETDIVLFPIFFSHLLTVTPCASPFSFLVCVFFHLVKGESIRKHVVW